MSTQKSETPITRSSRRDKEPGALSKVWNQTANTVLNGGSTVEHTVGIISDTMRLGRESLKPIMVDATVETLSSIAEGVTDLMSMGVTEDEARSYIMQNITY